MKAVFKKNLNFILDILLAVSGLLSLISGYILWFLLPRGIGFHGESDHCSGGGIGLVGNTEKILDLNRTQWINLHNWLSVALFIIILIHIILHWKWIFETTKRIKRYIDHRLTKAGVVYWTAAQLLVLFIFDCFSGIVIWLILPRGERDFYPMRSGIGREFLGLQRNIWADLHAWVAVAIIALLVIHIVVNWNWVVSVIKNIFKVKTKREF